MPSGHTRNRRMQHDHSEVSSNASWLEAGQQLRPTAWNPFSDFSTSLCCSSMCCLAHFLRDFMHISHAMYSTCLTPITGTTCIASCTSHVYCTLYKPHASHTVHGAGHMHAMCRPCALHMHAMCRPYALHMHHTYPIHVM